MNPLPEGWEDAPTAEAVAAKSRGGAPLGIRCLNCGTVGLWRVLHTRQGAGCIIRERKCIQCGNVQYPRER